MLFILFVLFDLFGLANFLKTQLFPLLAQLVFPLFSTDSPFSSRDIVELFKSCLLLQTNEREKSFACPIEFKHTLHNHRSKTSFSISILKLFYPVKPKCNYIHQPDRQAVLDEKKSLVFFQLSQVRQVTKFICFSLFICIF